MKCQHDHDCLQVHMTQCAEMMRDSCEEPPGFKWSATFFIQPFSSKPPASHSSDMSSTRPAWCIHTCKPHTRKHACIHACPSHNMSLPYHGSPTVHRAHFPICTVANVLQRLYTYFSVNVLQQLCTYCSFTPGAACSPTCPPNVPRCRCCCGGTWRCTSRR